MLLELLGAFAMANDLDKAKKAGDAAREAAEAMRRYQRENDDWDLLGCDCDHDDCDCW